MEKISCAKIAHEAKHPIAIISSVAQLIQQEYPVVKNHKHWASIFVELDNLSDLLLDYTRLESLDEEQEFLPIDLGEVLADVVDRYEPMAIRSNSSINFNLPDELFNIMGNESLLTDAFNNLVKNALEATDSDGSIFVSIEKNDDFITTTISDTGCGISNEDLPLIFKPFATFKKNGTGLGLAIVNNVVAKHNGNIRVNSELGKGTSFIIEFPCILS